MAWSAAFVAALNDRTATPTFHLGVVSGFSGLPGRWDVQTHRDVAGWGVIEGVQVQGAGLQLLDWTCSFGGFSVTIATDNPHVLLTQIVKGQIVALSAKFASTSAEPIAVGMVRNVSGMGGRYTIECSDFLSALGSRNTQTAAELALFSGLDDETTLGADYTAGDATITVASTTGFDREDGGSGLIWIHPSGVPGDDSFALTYTGKTGTTFTGCSAAGVAGTTATNVASGGAVTEGAWIDDHPIHMALKVLTSTGTAAANGAYDTLPRTWAYGIPQAYVDAADAATYVVLSTPASGSDDWHFAVGTPQTDGFGWLQQVLYLGGFFLVPLQGGISVRCIADPEDMREEAHIYSRDIEEIEEWMAYDPDYAAEVNSITIQSSSGGLATGDDPSGKVASLPAELGATVDVSSLVFANETAIRTEVANRMVPWLARIPERMVVRCAGRRMAALAPGDRVSVTTDLATGRLESTKRGYDRRAALVTRVDPDWMRGAVRVHLAILPTFTDALVS
jgi:hypothetical protein